MKPPTRSAPRPTLSTSEGTDERFSVIRRIGKADSTFLDRIADNCHTVKGGPGARHSWDKNNRTGVWMKWFRYSQIDIIRIERALAAPLETFLLSRIPMHENTRDAILKGKPIIYDATS